jgi:predicted AAA+ superfamily ATPase
MKDNLKKIILEGQENRVAHYKRDFSLIYPEEINTIIGLRRSGKTYFVFSQIESLLQNDLPPTEYIYINFDDERLAELKGKDLGLVMEAYFELFPGNRDKQVYLFFDEIQNIQDWHLFIKRLYEQKKFKITLTGSSSKFLGSEIATEMRGRTRTVHFFPLTFKEFLVFKDFKVTPNIEFSGDRFQLVHYAEEFSNWGGFPRVVLEKDPTRKKEILTDYLEMIIYKDIAERYGVRNTRLLKLMIHYTLSNFAAEFSVNGFIKKFQSEYRLNKETVFTYFSYLEEIGFLYYLPRFSYKLHQRYVSKKSYIGDNGFIPLLSFRGMEVQGRLLENLVFTELLKRGKNIFYFKDSSNYECDFITAEAEQVSEVIQVCHLLTAVNREREVRGIIAALKAFGLDKGIIITAGTGEEIKVNSYSLRVVPYWKWMLEHIKNHP